MRQTPRETESLIEVGERGSLGAAAAAAMFCSLAL